MTYAIPAEPLANLRAMVADNRIIRGKWHSTDEQGRETACLLGALGRDIDASSACPAAYMPRWLAEITPRLDDETSATAWPSVIARYAAVAGQWQTLDDAAWARVNLRLRREALLIAQPHDT